MGRTSSMMASRFLFDDASDRLAVSPTGLEANVLLATKNWAAGPCRLLSGSS